LSGSTFNLDFATMMANDALDSRLTFSRASNALQYNSAGTLVWAPENRVPSSNNLNGDWTLNTTAVVVSGFEGPFGLLDAFRAVHGGGFYGGLVRQYQANVLANQRLVYSVYAKAGTHSFIGLRYGANASNSDTYSYFNLSTGVATLVTPSAGTMNSVGMVSVGNGWWRCWIVYTPAASATAQVLDIALTTSAGDTQAVLVGNVFLYGPQTEYVAPTVAAPTAYKPTSPGSAFYGPRFDYHPGTLAFRGLLIEPQRTNLALQSDGTGALLGGATRTASAGTSPTGATDAVKLAETAVSATHDIQSVASGTAAASSSIALSAYVKAAERGFAILQLNNGASSAAAWCSFNLSTGAVVTAPTMLLGTFTSMVAYSEQCPNGWWRIYFLATLDAVANFSSYLGISNDGTTRSYLGTAGSGILFFGLQGEIGFQASSHIPTTGVTATRAEDDCNGDALLPLWRTSEGTILTVGTTSPGPAGQAFPVMFSVASSFSELIHVYANHTTTSSFELGIFARSGGATVLNANSGTLTANFARQRYTVRYRAGDWAMSANGAAVSTSAATVPTAPTGIGIGRNPPSVSGVNDVRWLQRIAYWRTGKSNSELVALSA
jgi:hypothetical protein